MRSFYITLLLSLFSYGGFSESAVIMYFDLFGDFMTEDHYEITIDPENHSIADILSRLEKLRSNDRSEQPFLDWTIDADLAIVGYGEEGIASNFFGATNDIHNKISLANALSLPAPTIDGKFFIYFINRLSSPYVRAEKAIFPLAPQAFLAGVGLQHPRYF